MDALAAAQRWVAAWSEAWPRRDPDVVVPLYASDAVIRTHPFRDAVHGPEGIRDYLVWSFEAERDVRCWYAEPVASDRCAVVEYWATLVSDDLPVTISGVASLSFDQDGRVTSQRDTWVAQAGHAPPPMEWLPTAPRVAVMHQSSGHG